MYDFTNFKNETKKIEEWLSNEYLSIHTGRARPAVLDRVQVESYGSRGPISNVASISTRDARTLHISPWDKGVVKDIEKAISASEKAIMSDVMDGNIKPEEGKAKLAKITAVKPDYSKVTATLPKAA